MGDVGDIYRDMHEAQQKRNAERLEANLSVLRASTIPFVYHENIATVLVREKGYPSVDFYASQSKWKVCASGKIVFGDAERLVRWLWDRGPKKGPWI